MNEPLTYKSAGVDIAAGDALVERIKPAAASTRRPGADVALGGFGALFDLARAGYSDPILVAATDGVGTKLRLAIEAGRHHGVGVDLVAMCVNDLVVQGAEPLFFLDYYATGRLDVEAAAKVIEGIAAGCRLAGCALVGGETAEMPGHYAAGDYDLAGFAVGAVERGRVLPRADITAGDVVIAVASSGLHSNGFSLARRVLERSGLRPEDAAPFQDQARLGDVLLEPTRIYVRAALSAIRETGAVKALAHITGGGIPGNLPRVLPEGMGAVIDLGQVERPPVFDWLAETGGIEAQEMLRTFNCGVGLMAVADRDSAPAVLDALSEAGERATVVGEIVQKFDLIRITGGPKART